jgi:hypothetical protein
MQALLKKQHHAMLAAGVHVEGFYVMACQDVYAAAAMSEVSEGSRCVDWQHMAGAWHLTRRVCCACAALKPCTGLAKMWAGSLAGQGKVAVCNLWLVLSCQLY